MSEDVHKSVSSEWYTYASLHTISRSQKEYN